MSGKIGPLSFLVGPQVRCDKDRRACGKVNTMTVPEIARSSNNTSSASMRGGQGKTPQDEKFLFSHIEFELRALDAVSLIAIVAASAETQHHRKQSDAKQGL